MTDMEILQAMEKLLDRKLEPIQDDIKMLQADMMEVKTDVKHIRKQVDILYNWVDDIDLRVKAIETV